MSWARVLNVAAGVWLMAAPELLGYQGWARLNDLIVGPLAAGAGAVALSEVTRLVRWVSVALGVWLLAAPWLLAYRDPTAVVNGLLAGVALVVSGLQEGQRRRRLGGGWSALWRGSHSLEGEAG
jgi:hypothetical protein